jgi:transcription elongation factor GreA
MNDTIYMSTAKYKELSNKLNHLKEVEFVKNRQEMRESIEQGGGTHDNAGYEHAAYNEKLLLAKIAELERVLSNVQVVADSQIVTNSVSLGTQVTVSNLDTKEKETFVIASPYRSDEDENHISYLAPIAKGLIGKKVNDTTEIKLPKGLCRYKILRIEKAKKW